MIAPIEARASEWLDRRLIDALGVIWLGFKRLRAASSGANWLPLRAHLLGAGNSANLARISPKSSEFAFRIISHHFESFRIISHRFASFRVLLSRFESRDSQTRTICETLRRIQARDELESSRVESRELKVETRDSKVEL